MALAGRLKGKLPLEVACMVWRLAEVMEIPNGVGSSSSSGVLESARLMVHPVSAAIVVVLGRGLGLEIALVA